jgi:hypothetical protein
MSFEEWVEFYNSKNPQDRFDRNEKYNLLFKEDKGFCEVAFDADMVFIGQLCGDARYWKAHIDEAARKTGIKHGGTINIRSKIRAYARLFGYKITETVKLSDGNQIILATHKETGKGFRASPAFAYDDGQVAYAVTWEI